MIEERLHIVSFDVPFPATYGGAIDVYYRLKALSHSGVKVTLHCTYKGELNHYDELESLCEKVYYYKRKTSLLQQFSRLPYTVIGRKNSDLLENLQADEAPILFEGLVTCYYMNSPELANRKKYFRECNVEHDYYRALAKVSTSVWKKVYLKLEARKLERFEKCLRKATGIFALAHQDEQHFKEQYPEVATYYVPCFHQNKEQTSKLGHGEYILYHGNLDVEENMYAARYIATQIAPKIPNIRFIIAGRSASCSPNEIGKRNNVEYVFNPSNAKMTELLENAHIHLLVTFQATGLKLKLVNVLYQGRYVVVNPEMVCGTELRDLCIVEKDADSLALQCRTLMEKNFSEEDVSARKATLMAFNNSILAQKFIERIY